jgi:hypothetical protein
MKMFLKFALLAVIFSSVFGCATSDTDFQTHLQMPESFNPIFHRYKALPEEKVLVVAVDPGGRWAFGYDHSRESLEEAAMNAAIKCDKARKKHNVFTEGTIFAVNDDVIYNDIK